MTHPSASWAGNSCCAPWRVSPWPGSSAAAAATQKKWAKEAHWCRKIQVKSYQNMWIVERKDRALGFAPLSPGRWQESDQKEKVQQMGLMQPHLTSTFGQVWQMPKLHLMELILFPAPLWLFSNIYLNRIWAVSALHFVNALIKKCNHEGQLWLK